MFEKPGEKIKGLAYIFFMLSFIGCVIYFLVMLFQGLSGLALIFLLVGPLFSWISSLLLYSWGSHISTCENIEIYISRNSVSERQSTEYVVANDKKPIAMPVKKHESNIPNGIRNEIIMKYSGLSKVELYNLYKENKISYAEYLEISKN